MNQIHGRTKHEKIFISTPDIHFITYSYTDDDICRSGSTGNRGLHIDDLIIETTLTVCDTPVQTRAVQSTSANKIVTAKNSNGKIVATFTLHGVFEYNGKSASCTSAIYSTSISDSTWSFSSANAWASASKAYGSYMLIRSINGQTVSGNVVITCSPTGTIS